jgi:hypothetical protein
MQYAAGENMGVAIRFVVVHSVKVAFTSVCAP